MGAPTGTVTLLFTDVEGSTKLLERLGDGFGDAIAEHHRIVREALERHGGYEVDTAGDGFFATFGRPGDAVACALEIQRALADWPARVRMGIHTGTPQWRDEKYVGMDVHRAARVMAAAHGGQVLVTDSTAALLGGDGLRDVGEHRLKDLPTPEHLWQAGDGEFPAPRSLNRSRLPMPLTALIGREDELREAVEALRTGTRLLTLTGTGGAGKTRLALAIAEDVAGDFSDGAVLVDLATVPDAGAVVPAITAAVPGAGDDVATRLRGRRLLLVLDNFEHVVEAATLVGQLLATEPGLSVLVTSRVPLRLRGEVERRVEPLPEAAARDLFVARARDAGVRLDPRDAATIAICRLLDGLPLAVELAAARLPLFGPNALAERLGHRLDVLAGGPRDAPERQRTLRGTIEWSHRLLDDPVAAVFRRLAVFRGGAAMDAAEAVCGEGALDGIVALLEASLVRRVEGAGGELRVTMLETVREFALERLVADDDAAAVADSHAAFFVALSDRQAAALFAADREAHTHRLSLEIDNIRAAHDRLLETAPEESLRLIGPSWFHWETTGPVREGRQRIGASLAVARGTAATRGHALVGAGWLALSVADADAAEQSINEALELLRTGADDILLSVVYSQAQQLAELRRDRPARRKLAERALEVALRTDNERLVTMARNNLADVLLRDDPEAAKALLQTLLEESRDDYSRMFARGNLAELALIDRRPGDARELAEAALEDARTLRNDRAQVWNLSTLASAALMDGDEAAARPALHAAAALNDRIGGRQFLPALLVLAAALLAAPDPHGAATALGAGDAVQHGLQLHDERLRDAVMSTVAAALGDEAFDAAHAAGAASDPENALRAALEA